MRYSPYIENKINKIMEEITRLHLPLADYNLRWISIKLLEGDKEIFEKIEKLKNGDKIISFVENMRKRVFEERGDPEILMANERYVFIKQVVSQITKGFRRITLSDRLDHVFLDKYFGIPIFLVILWIMFQFTSFLSAPFADLLADGFAFISGEFSGLTGIRYIDILFFGDYGILNGIGTVLSFVPIIFFLYLSLSVLEDVGYMARAAFIMDKLMRKLGLTGRAIISMILGFGCNVPAVYSCRAIPYKSDRTIAIAVNPLMLCSARLTVFSLFAYTFFKEGGGDIIFSLYLLGVILAIFIAKILRKTIFKGKISPFIVELPSYQMPTMRSILTHTWYRGGMFFKKAGTIIIGGLLILGILANLTPSLSFTEDIEESILANLGRFVEPIFYPLGWDWRLVVSAIFGFIAKEIVLGSLAMLYGVGEEGLGDKLSKLYDPITAYAYMVFILIYVPCIVTVAAIKHEAGWKWIIFTTLYEVILAYLMAFLFIIIGHLVI